MVGPQVEACELMHAEKYRGDHEPFREAMGRVASALSDGESHYQSFRDALLHMRFMPAGRVQAAMGSTRVVTPYNCFVSGTIDDSFTEGHGSICARFTEACETMRRGGGIGYDFSTLRPRGALIKKLQSRSSGPIAFMEVFDAGCRCVASSGHRRGAQMGVLRVDHPDIEEFVRAKQNQTELTGFNISVAVTDEFMRRVVDGQPFPLRFNGETYREVNPRSLWEVIMRSTWDWAEPGVIFIDRVNEMNNLRYCEQIAATNPCGEQPLPPYGACLLGSFNLVKYVIQSEDGYKFDWGTFARDIPTVVRAMDNVVDRAVYPLREQEIEAHSKRRMGLGITGTANALETLGHPYGSKTYLKCQGAILQFLANQAYLASVQLAAEKGPFSAFSSEEYLGSRFVERLDDYVRDGIRKFGIRNSHLISIAPTGTISFCADNVSSGIEPVYSYEQERDVLTPRGKETLRIQDYAFSNFGVRGKTSSAVTASEHLAVLASAQYWVDSAVSKTCNVNPKMPWSEFKGIYREAWLMGCKGVTTFNPGGKRFGVLREAAEEGPSQSCHIDPETGKRDCG